MSTGNRASAPKVKRTIVLGPVLGEDGRVVTQREEAEQRVLDLLGALWTVGGVVRIVADRIKVGTLPASANTGPEPVGETVGVIIEYQANTPLNDESVTAKLEDLIYADSDERDERVAAMVAATIGDDDEEVEPDEGSNEED